MNLTALEDFEKLKLQMNSFAVKMEGRLAEKRTGLMNDKQSHYIQLNDMKNQEIKLQNDIRNLSQKEMKMKETISLSLEALQIQQLKVNELKDKQNDLMEQKNALDREIQDLNKQLQDVNLKYNNNEEILVKQLRKDYPELLKFEQYLGLRIEVLDIDILRFVFTNIDANNSDREFWIEINVKLNDFKVEKTLPELGTEIETNLESDFNQHKELSKFLKATRSEFKKLV